MASKNGKASPSSSRPRSFPGRPPRFSLRRLFCRRPTPGKSMSTGAQSSTDPGTPEAFTAMESGESRHSLSLGRTERVSSSTLSSARSSGGKRLECPLCLQLLPDDQFPQLSMCSHRSCRDCLQKYLRIEISESRINVCCPECSELMHPNDMKDIVDDPALVNKYHEFMLRRVLLMEPDTRWCPAPDCNFAVIATGCASCPKLVCGRPECGAQFCYHCKQYWHPNQTCDTARAARALRSSSTSYSHDSMINRENIKPCPRCGTLVVKLDDGSCNHMTCTLCGAEFCWLCMKEISDLHYLSPSGCTFWGKKPWSRKKKLLWQLGTLVGAPVGIALVASVAVPAILIGVPVWVGRRLYSKLRPYSKHKRNLLITAGVTASIVVAPLIAGFAVCVGVPVLLAYVYGVVPISLCRSGGCGGAPSESGDIPFEMEDEPSEISPTVIPNPTPTEAPPGVNNPSIGPSIGEMSLGLTSSLSSHMERMGMVAEGGDRESASHRVLVGSSLTGSMSGGLHNRVEVQAEVVGNGQPPASTSHTHKRSSLSSESAANLSLDTKSATVSFSDTASTKGLAGSICTRDNITVHPQTQHNTDYEAPPPSSNRPSSPLSSRSVSFLCDETQRAEKEPGKSRKGRNSKIPQSSCSVGESIHEQPPLERSPALCHLAEPLPAPLLQTVPEGHQQLPASEGHCSLGDLYHTKQADSSTSSANSMCELLKPE